MFRSILILVHFLGVIAWVGGMFFAYFCLRPAAAQVLDPPQRLPLWVATLKRFFQVAACAVTLVLVSGFTMLAQTGFQSAPLGWHLMAGLGLTMACVFAFAYGIVYPRLRSHCDAAAWPMAAATLNSIRQLVGVNMLLALCTVAIAVLSRS